MSARALRMGVVAFLAFTLPSTVTADPITELDHLLVGDVLVINARYTLTHDDLLVLEARDDNGWHLGWFKRKLRAGGYEAINLPSIDGVSAAFGPLTLDGLINGPPSVNGVMLNALLGSSNAIGALAREQDGTSFIGGAATNGGAQSLDILAVPEPASIFLLGSGLLFLARRRIRNRASK